MNTYNLGYILEMLLPVIGICLPAKKRKYGLAKAAAIIAAGVFIGISLTSFLVNLGYEDETLSTIEAGSIAFGYIFVWFFLIWVSVIAAIFNWIEVTKQEAVYLFAISYAIEHIFYCIRVIVEYLSGGRIVEHEIVQYILTILLSFIFSYYWFAKRTIFNGKYLIQSISAAGATVVILAVVWGLSIIASFMNIAYIHSIYAIICCIFILINQRAQLIREIERLEFKAKEQLWKETELRYQFSKDAMAVVNQHYHDMKHQINALANMESDEKRRGLLSEMENDIAIYDAVVRTGSELIDTVLTEKKLICHSKDISMSCIADGKQLDFMDVLDLYTLLGNALDNAIEANEKISDKSKRWISVQIQDKKGIKLVEIINPYVGEIDLTDGLPKTSKADKRSHGFGTSSIKAITEKYNGQMVIKTDNNKYLLRLVF